MAFVLGIRYNFAFSPPWGFEVLEWILVELPPVDGEFKEVLDLSKLLGNSGSSVAAVQTLLAELFPMSKSDLAIVRFEFVGTLAPESVQRRYLGKSVRSYLVLGSQNPIKYVNRYDCFRNTILMVLSS